MKRSTSRPPVDWREKVARWAEYLALAPTHDLPGLGRTAVRRLAIAEARLALDPERGGASFLAEFGGVRYARAAWALRKLLDRAGVDWRSASGAENVMGVVQRTLDRHLGSPRLEPGESIVSET